MFGGGGFGIEVIEYFYETYNKLDYKIVGIIDEHKNNINEFKNYNNNDLIHYKSIEDTPIENHKFLISVLDTNTRERVYKSLNSRKAEFINLIHPKAYISSTAEIGNGIIVCPFAYVGPRSRILNNAVLNIQSTVGHDSIIGQSSFLGPGSRVNGSGKCGKKCFLGTNSVINVNVSLGENSKLSMGSVLTKDCPQNSLADGNPAKFRQMFK